ncbi:MAG: dihydroorotate dehydrogenase-like protein [Verrucomicrobiota bacterium]
MSLDLSTRYLGLKLKNPLMPGASPLCDNLDQVKRLEDAGAAAMVMHSLFAEQIERDGVAWNRHAHRWENTFAEAGSFFPRAEGYTLGPDEYLARVARLKEVCSVPVIASLNGVGVGGWVGHAALIEQAGADALELNAYFLATDPAESGEALEEGLLDIVRAVRERVSIPIAVKLSPFHTSVGHLVKRLGEAGAEGVVLFNRLFQPEIDVDLLEVRPKLELSTPEDLRVRLRWVGLLRDQVNVSLAASGGVHAPADVVKLILAGADAVQSVSALLRRGPQRLGDWLTDLQAWMTEHEYASVSEMKGALCMARCPDPDAYERGNYLRTLQLWRE